MEPITREQEAKQLLERLVDFMNSKSDMPSLDLWNILTALRGPDSEDDFLKNKTTARIRGAIGLDPRGLFFRVSTEKPCTLNFNEMDAQDHFRIHYNNAIRSLKKFGLL